MALLLPPQPQSLFSGSALLTSLQSCTERMRQKHINRRGGCPIEWSTEPEANTKAKGEAELLATSLLNGTAMSDMAAHCWIRCRESWLDEASPTHAELGSIRDFVAGRSTQQWMDHLMSPIEDGIGGILTSLGGSGSEHSIQTQKIAQLIQHCAKVALFPPDSSSDNGANDSPYLALHEHSMRLLVDICGEKEGKGRQSYLQQMGSIRIAFISVYKTALYHIAATALGKMGSGPFLHGALLEDGAVQWLAGLLHRESFPWQHKLRVEVRQMMANCTTLNIHQASCHFAEVCGRFMGPKGDSLEGGSHLPFLNDIFGIVDRAVGSDDDLFLRRDHFIGMLDKAFPQLEDCPMTIRKYVENDLIRFTLVQAHAMDAAAAQRALHSCRIHGHLRRSTTSSLGGGAVCFSEATFYPSQILFRSGAIWSEGARGSPFKIHSECLGSDPGRSLRTG